MGSRGGAVRRLAALLLFGWTVAAAPGVGIAAETRFLDSVPKELVQTVMGLARDNLSRARLPDGSNVPPETPAERARLLLPFEDAETVVDAGIASAYAKWCGEDWVRNFEAMMASQRRRGLWSDKTMAYIGMLHGITLGMMGRQFQRAGECPADERARIRAYIGRKD